MIMASKQRVMTPDSLEQRIFQLAKPLDAKTLKRAELAEHLISTTERIIEEVGSVVEGKPGSNAVRQIKIEGIERFARIMNELAEMGDPVAQCRLSEVLSMNKGAPADLARFAYTFLDDGFLIYPGTSVAMTNDGLTAQYSGNAYGIIFDRCEAEIGTFLVGSMLANEIRTSWLLDGRTAVTDISIPLREAMDVVNFIRFPSSEDLNITILGTDGKSLDKKPMRISAEELEVHVMKERMEDTFLQGLSAGTGREALERHLSVLAYHFEFLFGNKCKSEDEAEHVVSVLNRGIHDEIVRVCVRSYGLSQPVEQIASMAYGDASRALSILGQYLITCIVSKGYNAVREGEEYVMLIGSLLTQRNMGSATEYLKLICGLPEAKVRELAQQAMSFASETAGAIDRQAIRDMAGLERKRFVTKENLPKMLGALKYMEEEAPTFTMGKQMEAEFEGKD